MWVLFYTIILTFSTYVSAEDKCATPTYLQNVRLEDLLGKWYGIAQSDNLVDLKGKETCPVYHITAVNNNIVSGDSTFYKKNSNEKSAQIDFRLIFDSASPASGKYIANILNKEFSSQDGEQCYIIALESEKYYIFYCCSVTKQYGNQHMMHFLTREKFASDLFDEMKELAVKSNIPVNDLRQVSEQGCKN